MKPYTSKISLMKNKRGVYIIDTVMGCPSGMSHTEGGCYGDCYAARSAKTYGYDFSTAVLRDFENEGHKAKILNQISNIKMPFIRLGGSGDPSENWHHTLKILRVLARSNTELVIVTRHWNLLTDEQLQSLSAMNICINTSVSALDAESERLKSVEQFLSIKPFCKSVLRIVSCDFNIENDTGKRLADIQNDLFRHFPTIDTVFRPTKLNPFVVAGIVKTKPHFFNGRKQLASKFNAKTYMGKCLTCKEMCGVTIPSEFHYSNRLGVIKQTEFAWNKPKTDETNTIA